MSNPSMILSLALMVPFLGWGVYTLRVRYQYHEELHRSVEWITVGSVAAFFLAEMSLLRTWMVEQHPLMFALTALSLTVSMAALYGPIMVSLASSMFVQALMPSMDTVVDTPQFGPAESLERLGDHEGALQEYLVIARIFPKNTDTALRIGNKLEKLDRPEEASKAFERAFQLSSDEAQCLGIANRLHALYKDQLNEPAQAKAVLKRYLERFPDTQRADSIIRRMSDKGTASSVMRVRKELAEGKGETLREVELEPSGEASEVAAMLPDTTWSAPEVLGSGAEPAGEAVELELPELDAGEEPAAAEKETAPEPEPEGDEPELELAPELEPAPEKKTAPEPEPEIDEPDSSLSLDWSTAEDTPRPPTNRPRREGRSE